MSESKTGKSGGFRRILDNYRPEEKLKCKVCERLFDSKHALMTHQRLMKHKPDVKSK